jgi:hypothetical protein
VETMEFKWIVKYEDDKRFYKDSYTNEKIAKEYYEELKEKGYKNVSIHKKQ